jgi:hypothetical protein
MYDKKITKSATHYMKDHKLFLGDMQKVSQDILIFYMKSWIPNHKLVGINDKIKPRH